ncbi:hypothetical protein Tco_0854560 [Tanacetum coccineum]
MVRVLISLKKACACKESVYISKWKAEETQVAEVGIVVHALVAFGFLLQRLNEINWTCFRTRQKLDTGFFETIHQWEETFVSTYQRAGVMYRGTAPTPVTTSPCIRDSVMLEFVEIKSLLQVYKGKVSVVFSMAQPDGIFNVKGKRTIQSESGQKQFATFEE